MEGSDIAENRAHFAIDASAPADPCTGSVAVEIDADLYVTDAFFCWDSF